MNEGRCRERRRRKDDEDMRRMKVQECIKDSGIYI
jgi:hypothetical protein